MMEAIYGSPFFGLTLCIGTFFFGTWVQKKTKMVLANPLLIAAAICLAVMSLLKIPYEQFEKGANIIHWMLGPVTALLALGIYNQRAILKEYFIPVIVGCVVGCLTSMGSILILCKVFHVDAVIAASILPKSCTTPIAIGIAESRGGLAAIAVCGVMIAGLTGALFAPQFSKWFHITEPVAQGLATGASSHALGTTKAREMGEIQGAMSSIAIGVCGLLSVILSLFL